MKRNLRSITSLLLVLTGLIHISLFFELTPAPESAPALVLGVLYAVIGILLFKHASYSETLGIVFPAAGLLGGLFVVDPDSADILVKIFVLLIDVIIIVGCVILLRRTHDKTSRDHHENYPRIKSDQVKDFQKE